MEQKFNPNYHEPNLSYTREIAEQRLLSLGYKDFVFRNCSYNNGASFYFEAKDGREIRVSDHPLTNKRAFSVIDIPIVPPKILPTRFNTSDKKIMTNVGKYGGKIEISSGGYLWYEHMEDEEGVEEDCINIVRIDFVEDEDGKEIIATLQDIAKSLELPIVIYAFPGYKENITEEKLKSVLEDMGFTLHPKDTDETLYRWWS